MAIDIQTRFKDDAAAACELAKKEAVLYKHRSVTSLHVLIGLFLQGGEVTEILKAEGLTLEGLRRQLGKFNTKFHKINHDPQFVPRVLKSFHFALREAANDATEDLEEKAIGAEHLLRGLLRESGGTVGHTILKLSRTSPDDLYRKLVVVQPV